MKTNRQKSLRAAFPIVLMLACTNAVALDAGGLPSAFLPTVTDVRYQEMIEAAYELNSGLYGRRYGDVVSNSD